MQNKSSYRLSIGRVGKNFMRKYGPSNTLPDLPYWSDLEVQANLLSARPESCLIDFTTSGEHGIRAALRGLSGARSISMLLAGPDGPGGPAAGPTSAPAFRSRSNSSKSVAWLQWAAWHRPPRTLCRQSPAPVDLLLYYWRQGPYKENIFKYLNENGPEIDKLFLGSQFTKIWIYDRESESVLWKAERK